ncbi:MAG: MBL fold metallo-hydrolase [Omnitrophica bacterium RIFCSPHIGHO2_02_FULL_46_20]|nr:MAG: MBL fold metallo-hydrolase [Omnitrophica bacterium RIFCSPHIGHO2_02_FULL_46_20]
MSAHNFTVDRLEVGLMGANCYIVANSSTKDACLIDPGGEPDRIKNFLKKKGLNLKFIINTHGHGDHILGNGYFDCPVYIHRLEKDFLTDPNKNLSGMFGLFLKTSKAAKLLEDEEKVLLDDLELEIMHTPGHTPGGISIKLNGVVFTGDTLFAGGVGRTDLPDGNDETLLKSIKEKLFNLNDDTIVYPGHGEESTIGQEKRTNPFFV